MLGQLDEAAKMYENAIAQAEKQESLQDVAANKGQLATVRQMQRKYTDAIAGYEEVRHIFEQLKEPAMVATAWHQLGIVHEEAGNYAEAETAFRQSLVIKTQTKNRAGQASTLNQLGSLYAGSLKRLEEAVIFFRQATDIYVEFKDLRREGVTRSNIAETLCMLKRYDEARQEIIRSIKSISQFGHTAEPWRIFNILHNIDRETGNLSAALEAWQRARDAYLAYRRQKISL